jgi:uncharacterized protein
MPDFRIQIERLTGRPAPFRFEVTPGWWAARAGAREGELCEAEGPFEFTLTACRAGDDVVIEGECRGRVALECSRCGKRYAHALREPFRLVLEPLSAASALDPEGERGLAENGVCLGEDLEVGAYRGAVVGLDDFFGEVIALALPLQPLCDETCLGVCSHCGRERSDAPGAGCGCEDEKIESPFAVLARLKSRD